MLLIDNDILTVTTIAFSEAAEFVNRYHRHCNSPTGHKFSLGCWFGGRLVGVSICGRPVARKLDDGLTIEVNRLCTDGTRNACSKLYGYCVRYAKKIGAKKVITYTLQSEDGASLKASNFTLDAKGVGGLKWTGNRKHTSKELKNRWVFDLSK